MDSYWLFEGSSEPGGCLGKKPGIYKSGAICLGMGRDKYGSPYFPGRENSEARKFPLYSNVLITYWF